MKRGYARVSTEEQDTASQVAALKTYGCEEVFTENASGGSRDRPRLQACIEALEPGDVLVVWKLDRFSRSLSDLLALFGEIRNRGAGFASITESIDTTTPAGMMLAQMLGAFAEFERAMARERTLAGLAAARRAGRVGGRRAALTTEQKSYALMLLEAGKTQREVARLFDVGESTIRRLVSKTRGPG